MSSGKHTPPDDRSFAISLLGHLGAGVALVLIVAGGFWGLGQVRAPDTTPVITAPDDSPDPSPEAADTPDEELTDEAAGTPPPDEPEPVDDPDEADNEAVESDEATDDSDTTRAHEPQDVSVQVLDAAGDDGTRRQVAETRLRDDGYRIVATNPAVRTYERTTVFYTPGAETKAQQIADEYGYAVVEEKPDNLSASVDVHVVVGQDHPAG